MRHHRVLASLLALLVLAGCLDTDGKSRPPTSLRDHVESAGPNHAGLSLPARIGLLRLEGDRISEIGRAEEKAWRAMARKLGSDKVRLRAFTPKTFKAARSRARQWDVVGWFDEYHARGGLWSEPPGPKDWGEKVRRSLTPRRKLQVADSQRLVREALRASAVLGHDAVLIYEVSGPERHSPLAWIFGFPVMVAKNLHHRETSVGFLISLHTGRLVGAPKAEESAWLMENFARQLATRDMIRRTGGLIETFAHSIGAHSTGTREK